MTALTALVAALAGLVTAAAALVRAIKGEADHANNATAIREHATRIASLEKATTPRTENRIA